MSHETDPGHNPEAKIAIDLVRKDLGENLPTRSEFVTLPPYEWYEHVDGGLHGVNHIARATFLGILDTRLAQKADSIHINENIVIWSLLGHDIARITDVCDDEGHGLRAADWIRENDPNRIPQEIREDVLQIISWHDILTIQTPQEIITGELSLVKDSDALDRVRFSETEVAQSQKIDPSRLRFEFSKRLLPIAEQLYERTHESSESFSSVADAAVSMGIMQNE